MKQIAVVCKTFWELEDYAELWNKLHGTTFKHTNNANEYVCYNKNIRLFWVSHVERIRGMADLEFRYIGNFYERKDLAEIQLMQKMLELLAQPPKENYLTPDQFREYMEGKW